MLSKKRPRVSKVKSLCTREFAVKLRKPGKMRWRYQDPESTISGGIGILLLFMHTCRLMVLSDQYRVVFKTNLFAKPFKLPINSTEQLAVVYNGLPMFDMPGNMARLACVRGWVKKDIVDTPMVTGGIVILIRPTDEGDLLMVGFCNKVFRVKICTIRIEPVFLIFKPIIDGECRWANEDTHKLLSLNARRTMIVTTAEHTLNAQPTPLHTACTLILILILVANCVRLAKKRPTYYPEYFVQNIDATSDIHMTYNTNPDAIVQRCYF